MKNLFALTILACIALILSCQKQQLPSTNAPVNPHASAYRITNQNPYNYIGVLHNGSLDSVASVSGFSSLSNSQKYQIISTYNDQHDGTSTNLPYSNISSSVSDALDNGSTRFDIRSKLENKGLAPSVASDAEDLLYIIGYGNNLTENDVKSVDSVTDQIERWEGNMITKYGSYNVKLTSGLDLTTDSGRVAYLLGAAAIAKYSYTYWTTVLENPSSPWAYKVSGSPTGPFWETPSGLRLSNAIADVGGWLHKIHISILEPGQSDVISVNLHEARAAAQAASSN